MGDSEEEFEPLFDYTRVQPFKPFLLVDDCLDSPPGGFKKKPKTNDFAVDKNGGDEDEIVIINAKTNDFAVGKNGGDEDEVVIINAIDDKTNKDDENWLPTRSKITTDKTKSAEDSIIRQFRTKRQELESIAQSAEESVKQEVAAAESNQRILSEEFVAIDGGKDHLERPSQEREKIIISIQNKDESKQLRVYMDDKFEKLFKLYADRLKLDPQNLIFSFDGDKISPTATPGCLGMEDNDIVEVYFKKQ